MTMMRSRAALMIFPDRIEARLFGTRHWVKPPSTLLQSRVVHDLEAGREGAVVQDVLTSLGAPHARVDVILSDALCRSLAIRRPMGATNAAELGASLDARFQRAFGEESEQWLLARESRALATHDLMCAVPVALHEAVTDAVRGASMKMNSMRPFWVYCLLEEPRSRDESARYAVCSDGHANTVALIRHGECLGVRTTRRRDSDALHEILARKAALFEDAHEVREVSLWGIPYGDDGGGLVLQFSVDARGWPHLWGGGSGASSP